MNPFESFSCCFHDSWNAAIPAMIEKTMKVSETMDQMMPQQCEEPPYLLANWLASELLTLRSMRSSHCCTKEPSANPAAYSTPKDCREEIKSTHDIPDAIKRAHDTDE